MKDGLIDDVDDILWFYKHANPDKNGIQEFWTGGHEKLEGEGGRSQDGTRSYQSHTSVWLSMFSSREVKDMSRGSDTRLERRLKEKQ